VTNASQELFVCSGNPQIGIIESIQEKSTCLTIELYNNSQRNTDVCPSNASLTCLDACMNSNTVVQEVKAACVRQLAKGTLENV
jgi:hypothetical protein